MRARVFLMSSLKQYLLSTQNHSVRRTLALKLTYSSGGNKQKSGLHHSLESVWCIENKGAGSAGRRGGVCMWIDGSGKKLLGQ